ncbi:MAG: ribose 5-phosphate isomerase B [Chloroflexi bacterium]|nr:ribose 5-phosphate isomerase B [Chloroflexota bacterium]
MKIAIGCDHVGLELKKDLMEFLDELQMGHHDFGTHDSLRTDYPLFAEKVAHAITDEGFDLGILICGTGLGMSIAANKIPGIRAAACSDTYSARMARLHNNANILALGAQVVGKGLARSIVKEWLFAEFEGGRHQKRIDMIASLEQRVSP